MAPPRNKHRLAPRYKDLHIQPKRFKSQRGNALIKVYSYDFDSDRGYSRGTNASYGYYQAGMLYRGTDNKIHRFT